MKRIFVILLGIAVATVVLLPVGGEASPSQGHSCCAASQCDEGLTVKTCCANAPAAPVPATSLTLDQLVKFAPAGESVTPLPRLACEGRGQDESDGEPDDKQELYLKNQHFLI